MASKKGLVLGVGILGISALALMNMDTSTTSSLPQSGGISQTSGNTTTDDFTDDDEMNKSSAECSLVWDSNGNRINNTWVYHGMVDIDKWDRNTCDLNGFRCKVYTDKRHYIAGESIKILMLKCYYENDGSAEWRPWTRQTKVFGERLAFMLGIESTDGYSFYDFQHTKGTEIMKGTERGDADDIELNGDLTSWPWLKENRGITMISLSTSDSDVGEYMIRFAGELGPYQTGSFCGASACLNANDDDCNNRERTSQKLIGIHPSDCKNESSAESYKEAEGKKNCGCGQDPCITELAKQAKEAEGGNVLRAEHFIQSYHQNWV